MGQKVAKANDQDLSNFSNQRSTSVTNTSCVNRTALADAIKRNDDAQVLRLVDKTTVDELQVVEEQLGSLTSLEYTCHKGIAHLAAYILDCQAGYALPKADLVTAFHLAAQEGHTDIIRLLLRHGVPPDLCEKRLCMNLSVTWSATFPPYLEEYCHFSNNITALHRAAAKGHHHAVAVLLDGGSAVKNRKWKTTPLHWAAGGGHLMVVRLLLRNCNLQADILDDRSETPVHWAARSGHSEVVSFLLEDMGKTSDMSNFSTAIHLASGEGHLSVVRIILEFGLKVNVRDKFGCSPLHDAAMEGHTEVAQLLIETDPDIIMSVDNEGCTPLHRASEYGHHTLVETLLRSIPLENLAEMIDHDGLTPMHLAAREDHCEVIQLLLKSGMKCNKENSRGKLPIHLATEYGRSNSFRILLEQSLTLLNVPDFSGSTVVHYAARKLPPSDILQVLKSGGDPWIRNSINERPIDDIPSTVLEEFLDLCITTDRTETACHLIVPYDFFLPNDNDRDDITPEVDRLEYLSRCRTSHRELLKHPVCASLIYLKWQCVSFFFWLNLFIYAFYVAVQTRYLLSEIGHHGVTQALSPLVIFICIIIFLREVLQILISRHFYFMDFENWMEILSIVFTVIVLSQFGNNNLKVHLAAIAILLSWSELVFLIGRHPFFVSYVAMFTTVTINYLCCLCAFVFFILAFGLALHLLFTLPAGPDTLVKSMMKAFVMTTGEIDFGNLDFQIAPGTSHIVFLLFIFLIVLVLVNLLNGLAVSDTQVIQQKAEVIGIVSRLRFIRLVEKVLLWNPFGCYHSSKRVNHRPFICCRIRRALFSQAFLCVRLPERKLCVQLTDPVVRVSPRNFRLSKELVTSFRACIEHTRLKERNKQQLDISAALERLEHMMTDIKEEILKQKCNI